MFEKISKEAVRKDMLRRRKEQSLHDVELLSAKAQNILLSQKIWQEAQRVALYMPTQGEIQTQDLCSQAWGQGKKVFLPRCQQDKQGHMDFIACQNMQDLAVGKYGIVEPKHDMVAPDQTTLQLDILLIPGVAFTPKGQRIGYGGGYYDRFLHILSEDKVLCVGFAFSWQIVDVLPTQEWDVPVQALISDEGILWV